MLPAAQTKKIIVKRTTTEGEDGLGEDTGNLTLSQRHVNRPAGLVVVVVTITLNLVHSFFFGSSSQ